MKPAPVHSPGFLAAVERVKGSVRTVSVTDAAAQTQPSGQLIDVREDDEWREGHIAGAVHIGKGVIERDIEAQFPDKQTALVLYCSGGFRSTLAAHALQQMGYQNVSSMAGGVRAWLDVGLPLVKEG